MKERIWLLPVALIVFLTTALLTVILIRLQNPFAVFPRFHVPYMAFFSLLALLAEHYLAPGRVRPRLTAAIPAASTICLAAALMDAGAAGTGFSSPALSEGSAAASGSSPRPAHIGRPS